MAHSRGWQGVLAEGQRPQFPSTRASPPAPSAPPLCSGGRHMAFYEPSLRRQTAAVMSGIVPPPNSCAGVLTPSSSGCDCGGDGVFKERIKVK